MDPLAGAQGQAPAKRWAEPALLAKWLIVLPHFPQDMGAAARGHQRHGQVEPQKGWHHSRTQG